MIESWHWYGPLNTITLPEVAQTRANGIIKRCTKSLMVRSGLSVTFVLIKP